jgi:hypothetical protein
MMYKYKRHLIRVMLSIHTDHKIEIKKHPNKGAIAVSVVQSREWRNGNLTEMQKLRAKNIAEDKIELHACLYGQLRIYIYVCINTHKHTFLHKHMLSLFLFV